MFLRYLGLTKNFKYLGTDFSSGSAEVSDETGKRWINESPGSFKEISENEADDPALNNSKEEAWGDAETKKKKEMLKEALSDVLNGKPSDNTVEGRDFTGDNTVEGRGFTGRDFTGVKPQVDSSRDTQAKEIAARDAKSAEEAAKFAKEEAAKRTVGKK